MPPKKQFFQSIFFFLLQICMVKSIVLCPLDTTRVAQSIAGKLLEQFFQSNFTTDLYGEINSAVPP